MNIESSTHDVTVSVDGEPIYEASTYSTPKPIRFRPVRVKVHIYVDGQARAEVVGYKQTKAGADFKDMMSVDYWGYRNEVRPEFVEEAIAAARAFIAAGSR